MVTRTSDLSVYPNHNQGSQLMLSLRNIAAGSAPVSIDVPVTFGKRMIARTIATVKAW